MRPIQVCAWLIVVASLASCKDKDAGSLPSDAQLAPSASPSNACPDGSSDDPPKSEFRPAIGMLRDKKYVAAQQRLRNLCEKYPRSATLRIWLGDAILYDSDKDYKLAADGALAEYRIAEDLQRRGCGLREAMHYYLAMGSAYAHLRRHDVAAARKYLDDARQRWPTSAEVTYHQARASGLAKDYDRALEELAITFEIAQQRQRPLFLRVHRSLGDWFERAERQSEFKDLRALRAPDYQRVKQRFQGQSTAVPERDTRQGSGMPDSE